MLRRFSFRESSVTFESRSVNWLTMVHEKIATRNHHPSTFHGQNVAASRVPAKPLVIPRDVKEVELDIRGRRVKLTNLQKLFWPNIGLTKRDLLQYYAGVAPVLLPHLRNRAMVMKRYPNGADGDFFFMKHAPTPRPDWVEICSIEHSSGNIVHFPVIQDMASLLWVVNLGCIDLNQWYAQCDNVDLPDYLHFDLDPVPGATFEGVRKTALILKAALDAFGMRNYPKSTGSRGIHVYVPIDRGPTQKEVWTFAKKLAQVLAAHDPKLITAEYVVSKRPKGRVLVDYNQNAWGRTLASVYSARPRAVASVSAPVTWREVETGFEIEDFRLDNMMARIGEVGDLWKPLLMKRGRVKSEAFKLSVEALTSQS